MPIRLDSRSADFAARFSAFLATKREVSEDVDQAARAIIADVQKNGDRALIELSRKFDRVDLDQVGLRVTAAELDAATASRPITNVRSRLTTASPMRSGSSSAIAGPRSRQSASMSRAAPLPIRHRC